MLLQQLPKMLSLQSWCTTLPHAVANKCMQCLCIASLIFAKQCEQCSHTGIKTCVLPTHWLQHRECLQWLGFQNTHIGYSPLPTSASSVFAAGTQNAGLSEPAHSMVSNPCQRVWVMLLQHNIIYLFQEAQVMLLQQTPKMLGYQNPHTTWPLSFVA